MTEVSRPLPEPAPEISLYRDHCIALLRRYFCMAVEIGRLPALLGRECFRAQAHDYHVHSFEGLVVFVIDVERCLDRLDPFDKRLIALIVLEEHPEEDAARLLHCGLRTIQRRLPEALDALTEMFLRADMLDLNQRVRTQPMESPEQARRGRRMPQRSPQRVSIQAAADPSAPLPPGLPEFPGLEPPTPAPLASLVKPPFSEFSPQPAVAEENIILSEVAGLPPPMCYAG